MGGLYGLKGPPKALDLKLSLFEVVLEASGTLLGATWRDGNPSIFFVSSTALRFSVVGTKNKDRHYLLENIPRGGRTTKSHPTSILKSIQEKLLLTHVTVFSAVQQVYEHDDIEVDFPCFEFVSSLLNDCRAFTLPSPLHHRHQSLFLQPSTSYAQQQQTQCDSHQLASR